MRSDAEGGTPAQRPIRPLVERLRQARHATRWTRGLDVDYPVAWESDSLCQEAADEIERLRAALQDADTIMGHDDAATEWRVRWADLWPDAALTGPPEAEVRLNDVLGAWQPIETAPRDGTKVLLVNDSGTMDLAGYVEQWTEHDEFVRRAKDGDVYRNVREECGYWDTAIAYCPTHWIPLPDPPQRA